MNIEEQREILRKIKVENIVWFIYIGLIAICLYGNQVEKHYVLFEDNYSKEKYRKIIIVVFTIAVIVYLYFFFDNYKDVKNIKPTDSQRKKDLNELSLVGSTLILISGIIFLYIAIVDTDLDVELAFN